jgi:ankyrin repeat protein
MTDVPRLAQRVAAFCAASVQGWDRSAVRMLAETPEIAGYSLATALLLGDVERVRQHVERDPEAAVRRDPATGWTPLHAVCASRWHQFDPGRAAGLVATARLLLDAGADLNAPMGPGGRAPLQCVAAVASSGAGNDGLIRLLLERGAVPIADDFYLAAFSSDGYRCLRLLLSYAPAVARDAGQALAAPISTRDAAGVRLLLDGGVDPRRYADDDGRPASAVYAAVHAGCPAEVIALLTGHGADPAQPGPDGHTAAWLATVYGRTELAAHLGAQADVTDTAVFAGACRRGDRVSATARAAADPTLAARLTEGEQAALVHAAEAGDAAAVALMLDLGFPVAARRPDDGATALHAAAYAGSAPVVRLLIERGADLAARDDQWQSTPLDWAAVGSGYRPDSAPRPDWTATVRTLLEAGASAADVSLDDGPKRPSPEVADLLRAHLAKGTTGPATSGPGTTEPGTTGPRA